MKAKENYKETYAENYKVKYDSLVCLFLTFISILLITFTHFLRHLEMDNYTVEKVIILLAFVVYTAVASLILVYCLRRLGIKTRMVKVSTGINFALVALGIFHIILEIVFLAK